MTPTTTPPAARVVYISGPMTGLEDYNRPAFHAAAERLAAAGYEPINPAAVTLDPATLGGRDPEWSDYMRHHVAVLAQGGVDIVAMLPGWEASRGARLERHLATELGIEVSTVAALTEKPPAAPAYRGGTREISLVCSLDSPVPDIVLPAGRRLIPGGVSLRLSASEGEVRMMCTVGGIHGVHWTWESSRGRLKLPSGMPGWLEALAREWLASEEATTWLRCTDMEAQP